MVKDGAEADRLVDQHLGMDSGWFPGLLDAYFDSLASDLPIWRVFKREGVQPDSRPGVPITEEGTWDETWKRIMELREKDPNSRYDCDHDIDVMSARSSQAVWTDLTKMTPAVSATMDARFRFVFSHRRATRLQRSSLPTACSIRARPL